MVERVPERKARKRVKEKGEREREREREWLKFGRKKKSDDEDFLW